MSEAKDNPFEEGLEADESVIARKVWKPKSKSSVEDQANFISPLGRKDISSRNQTWGKDEVVVELKDGGFTRISRAVVENMGFKPPKP